ncbi:MAG: DUF3387 domain-containing protein, partial [Conexivisphaerales archaeon]
MRESRDKQDHARGTAIMMRWRGKTMLRRLLNYQICIRMRKNIVQQKSFLEVLERVIKICTNRSI